MYIRKYITAIEFCLKRLFDGVMTHFLTIGSVSNVSRSCRRLLVEVLPEMVLLLQIETVCLGMEDRNGLQPELFAGPLLDVPSFRFVVCVLIVTVK